MPDSNYAPCPNCKALNMAHRRECWRCKRVIPPSINLIARYSTPSKKPVAAPKPNLPETPTEESVKEIRITIPVLFRRPVKE